MRLNKIVAVKPSTNCAALHYTFSIRINIYHMYARSLIGNYFYPLVRGMIFYILTPFVHICRSILWSKP